MGICYSGKSRNVNTNLGCKETDSKLIRRGGGEEERIGKLGSFRLKH